MKSLVALLVLAVPAIATPCRTVVYQQAEVVVPYVQTQVITVAVPTYTLVPYPVVAVPNPLQLAPASYTPPSAIPTAGPDVMQELLAEIRGMRAEFKALVNTPPDLSPPKLGAPKKDVDPVIVALTKNCAKCHGATADKDGAGFAMFKPTGEFIPVAPRDARRIVSLVSTGKMPPPPAKCGPAEMDAIVKTFKQ